MLSAISGGTAFVVATIGVVAMSSCAPAPPREEIVAETATLRVAARGLLRDVHAAPVAGARVEGRPAGGGATVASETTSTDGSFALKVRAGTCDILVEARSGFAPQSFGSG